MTHNKKMILIVMCFGMVSCVFRKSPEPGEIKLVETMKKIDDIPEKSPPRPARSSFQIQSLPEGWTVDRHPVAKWGMSLPTVMSNVLDSAQTVEYWDEIIDLPTGYKLPLKRSKVIFQIVTRLTIETVELQFLNVDQIYSSTNHEPSHFILNGVVRTIELKPTRFPQLTADDVIKYKFLMEYGTPREFVNGFHKYENSQTILKVRDLDKSHVQIQMNSTAVDEKLQTAIDDMYSEQGIEYQKKLLLRSIDF